MDNIVEVVKDNCINKKTLELFCDLDVIHKFEEEGMSREEICENFPKEKIALVKAILDKGWNTKLIAFKFIEFDYLDGIIFNVYESNGDNIKYLSTFSDANKNNNLEEMRVCLATEKLKLLEEHPKFDAKSILLKGKTGCILSYNGENNYSYISDEKEFYSNEGKIEFFLNEVVQNNVETDNKFKNANNNEEVEELEIILDEKIEDISINKENLPVVKKSIFKKIIDYIKVKYLKIKNK